MVVPRLSCYIWQGNHAAIASVMKSSVMSGGRRSLTSMLCTRKLTQFDCYGRESPRRIPGGNFRTASTIGDEQFNVAAHDKSYIVFDDNDPGDDNEDDDHEDDDSSEAEIQPWKSLLETPARAAWRVSDPHPPQSLLNAMYNILDDGERTPKQLRRAHRKILSIHSDLMVLRERERRSLVNGKRFTSRQRQNRVVYSNGNSFSNDESPFQPAIYGYDETLAALKHRLLPSYAITKRVLAECQSLLGGRSSTSARAWKPKRILDFGIGCGSASAAAIDLFEDSVEWVHGIDPSQTMRECSRKLIEEMTRGEPSRLTIPRVTFSNSLSASEVLSSNNEVSSEGGRFDLGLFTYTATELPDIMSCLAAAALLFEKVQPGGIFVMIEPGTPDGFNSVRAVRNMLLDCCPPNDPDFEWDERCHILAPCTHNGRCPMERHKKNFFQQRGKLGHDLPQMLSDEEEGIEKYQFMDKERNGDKDQDFMELSSRHGLISETEAFNSSFCSFVQTIPGADATKKGEKFSYLVAQKKRFSQPLSLVERQDPFQGDSLRDLLARSFDAASQEDDAMARGVFEKASELRSRYVSSDDDDLGLDLIRGDRKRESMGRIIRAPIKKKGHVYIDYCAAPGRIVRSRVTKAMSSNIAPGVYSAARKSRWGGLWPDTMDRIFSISKTSK